MAKNGYGKKKINWGWILLIIGVLLIIYNYLNSPYSNFDEFNLMGMVAGIYMSFWSGSGNITLPALILIVIGFLKLRSK